MSGWTTDRLEAHAKARWTAARRSFEAEENAAGWIHLLAMGCCMAALEFEQDPKKRGDRFVDVEKIARAGGLIA